MQAGQRIVVGFDGSVEARLAVRWAANLAVAEGRGLHLVHCWLWPLFTHDLGPVEGVAGSGLRHSAEAIIEDGVAEARAVAPVLDIKTSLVTGSASYVLEEISRQQRMLVVGSRGIGGFLGLLVGSVSLQLAVTAKCPVAILRSAGNANGPVVVGVDGSAESKMALDDACGLAGLWDAPLKILHVQKSMGRFGRGRLTADAETEAKAILDDAVTRARAHAADVPVQEELVLKTSPPGALVEASQNARILVVGAKGKGEFAGNVGSTAHAVLHHAAGPVLVSRRGTAPEAGEGVSGGLPRS